MSETTTQTGLSDHTAGAIAYITFVPAIVFLFMPPYSTRPFVRFHAWQSIFLNVTAFLVNVILSMLAVMTLFMGPMMFSTVIRVIWVIWTLLWILCVLQAVNGKRFKLPLIGNIAENLSTK